jgi:RNA polymerase sigma factor (sigma-70 family)
MDIRVTEQKKRDEYVSDNVSRAKEIFVAHGDFLRIIIRLHIDNEFDADEFHQELFLFLILKPLPKDVDSVKGLLNKIVVDRVKDFYRRKGSYKRRIIRYAEMNKVDAARNSPETIVVEKEETEKMFELIRRSLSPVQAQAVTLKFKYNFNNEEIADKMEINSRSASRYVSVGINKIKTLLV